MAMRELPFCGVDYKLRAVLNEEWNEESGSFTVFITPLRPVRWSSWQITNIHICKVCQLTSTSMREHFLSHQRAVSRHCLFPCLVSNNLTFCCSVSVSVSDLKGRDVSSFPVFVLSCMNNAHCLCCTVFKSALADMLTCDEPATACSRSSVGWTTWCFSSVVFSGLLVVAWADGRTLRNVSVYVQSRHGRGPAGAARGLLEQLPTVSTSQ